MENGHRGRVVHVRHIHATRYCGIGYESETTGHDIMESYMEQIKHSENSNSMQNGRKRMTKTEMRNAFQLKYRHRSLDLDTPLRLQAVPEEATLDVVPRLLGGGGDGGSTGAEDRAAYLAMYAGKKHDAIDPAEQKLAQYTTCHLSGDPLSPPCVCDELGNLYNKDAVLKALLEKNVPKGLAHITSRKHVFDVVLFTASTERDSRVQFGCPVTQLPLNGKYKFVILMTEGKKRHVVSEKAIKDMKVVVEETVGGPWTEVLAVYPQGEELDAVIDAVIDKRRQENEKKKKKKKRGIDEINGMELRRNGESNTDEEVRQKKIKELMPAHANPEVWKSLFASNGKTETKKNDYMVRGGLKYI